jgi:hypothetical protein
MREKFLRPRGNTNAQAPPRVKGARGDPLRRPILFRKLLFPCPKRLMKIYSRQICAADREASGALPKENPQTYPQ